MVWGGLWLGGRWAAEEPVFPAAVRLGGVSGLPLGHHTHTHMHTHALTVSLPPFLPTWVVPSGPWACLLVRAEDSRESYSTIVGNREKPWGPVGPGATTP